jgi:hypothetical protein
MPVKRSRAPLSLRLDLSNNNINQSSQFLSKDNEKMSLAPREPKFVKVDDRVIVTGV